MRPELFRITTDGPGRLATMARPRGGDWLVDELAGLAATGVDDLVCLLQPPELAELDLLDEPAPRSSCTAAAGSAARGLPVPETADQVEFVARLVR